jgi:protein-disulfide isomerase
MTRLRLSLTTSLAVLTALGACSKGPAERTAAPAAAAAPTGSAQARTAAGSDVVAEIDGQPVLAADLDRRAESRLARLRQEEYEIRKQALDELIWERLLEREAARQKVSKDALVAREVDGKAGEPSPSQIDSIYEQNKARFAGQSREEAALRIRMVLAQRARQERRAAYESELRQQAKVAVRLPVPRTPVEIPAGAPSTGPDTAAVTIVEFTDYQCPFCHRAQSVVDEVLTRYKGKVRLVHRDFPLEGHPGAFPAARAARCAGEQGRFWEYHRSLMTVNGALDDADLKQRAAAAGLDASKFGSCVASKRHDEGIRESFAQGEALGVTGTPAYFINGRMLSGARPIDAFAEVIDSELAGR